MYTLQSIIDLLTYLENYRKEIIQVQSALLEVYHYHLLKTKFSALYRPLTNFYLVRPSLFCQRVGIPIHVSSSSHWTSLITPRLRFNIVLHRSGLHRRIVASTPHGEHFHEQLNSWISLIQWFAECFLTHRLSDKLFGLASTTLCSPNRRHARQQRAHNEPR